MIPLTMLCRFFAHATSKPSRCSKTLHEGPPMPQDTRHSLSDVAKSNRTRQRPTARLAVVVGDQFDHHAPLIKGLDAPVVTSPD